jgi:hypothetical protein
MGDTFLLGGLGHLGKLARSLDWKCLALFQGKADAAESAPCRCPPIGTSLEYG